MHVNLRELKPNPMRDFTVDPLDESVVEQLKQSIKEDGFWGGVVARKIKGGDIQVAAGWHRVKAAIKAGVDRADVFVADDMDDASLIRVYARENATQRGNTGTAQAGTIAAAVRYLAKSIMTGAVTREITSDIDIDKARQHLTADRGIGEPIVTKFLEGVPGTNENSVRQQLAILKSSGDYARIIKEVGNEIERENKEAIKALEKADREAREAEAAAVKIAQERKEIAAREKAARDEATRKRAEHDRQQAEAMAKLAEKRRKEAETEAAKFDALRTIVDTARRATDKVNGTDVTFNFEGVAKHLSNSSHIETFRKIVTGQGISPYLPVSKQASLAAELVKRAKQKDAELTSAFIRDNIGAMVHSIVVENKRFAKEEAERLKKQNWESQWRAYQEDFSRQARGLLAAAMKMAKHAKDRPNGVTLYMTGEFKENLKRAKEAIRLIESKL